MIDTLTANEISLTFLALFLLLLFSFFGGKIFEALRAPKVVGEIVGGMVLGGSCIGLLFPDCFHSIFNGYTEEGKVLNSFYQMGLVFLMFSSGFNTSIHITKHNVKNYGLLFVGSTFIPMMLGLLFIGIFQDSFIGAANNKMAFSIVFVIAIAITSIPVISKIFFDIGMMNTKFSNMVLTVSTLQDLCLWILLNMSLSLVETGEFKFLTLIITAIITIGLLVAVKMLEYFIKKMKMMISKNVLPTSLCVLFVTIYILSKLNINIMYSAFIGGYIMKSLLSENNKEVEKIKDCAFAFFVPVYFALVGIQLDIIHNFSFQRFLLFFVIAFGLEFIGTVGLMWWTKLKKKTVISLGVTMNARGGPGIVLATTAFAYNIINIEFFTVLIFTTMLSSTLAGYWLRYAKNEIQDEG